jgi:hypothetical protein
VDAASAGVEAARAAWQRQGAVLEAAEADLAVARAAVQSMEAALQVTHSCSSINLHVHPMRQCGYSWGLLGRQWQCVHRLFASIVHAQKLSAMPLQCVDSSLMALSMRGSKGSTHVSRCIVTTGEQYCPAVIHHAACRLTVARPAVCYTRRTVLHSDMSASLGAVLLTSVWNDGRFRCPLSSARADHSIKQQVPTLGPQVVGENRT